MTTIALFGATGRTGREVLRLLERDGYAVRALARNPRSLTPSAALTVIEGDVRDADAVGRVIHGSDLVISVFGQVKGSSPTVQTDGTALIIDAMRREGVRRIVSLSGGALPAPEDQPRFADRFFTALLRRLAPDMLDDALGHFRELAATGLDWTIVRAPRLTDSRRGRYRVGWAGINASTSIGRADLAAFIVREAVERSFIRKMPFVSY